MGVRRGSESASAQLTQYILGRINTRKGVGRLLVQLLLLAAAGTTELETTLSAYLSIGFPRIARAASQSRIHPARRMCDFRVQPSSVYTAEVHVELLKL